MSPRPEVLVRVHHRRLAILKACTERRMTSVELAEHLGWGRDTMRDDGAKLVLEGLLTSRPGGRGGGYDITADGHMYLIENRRHVA